MDWMNRVVVIFCLPFMMACGVQRPAARAVVEQPRVDVSVPESPLSCEYGADTDRLSVAGDLPEMHFEGLESQHVRVRGIHTPLPADGLKIRLDDLVEQFTYPVQGPLISDYGMRRGRPHTGIDLRARRGDTIRAVLPGVVRMSKLYSSYGNIVVIRHYNGLETVYSHNTRNLVSSNDVVSTGQPIALAGRTGRATTDHLHFEVRAAGEPIDPKLFVDPDNMSLRGGWLFINDNNGKIVAASSVAELEDKTTKLEIATVAHDTARAEALEQSKVQHVAQTPNPTYHTVKKGEVLGRIARNYNTSVSRLCSLNNLKSPDRIREGQRLRVK